MRRLATSTLFSPRTTRNTLSFIIILFYLLPITIIDSYLNEHIAELLQIGRFPIFIALFLFIIVERKSYVSISIITFLLLAMCSSFLSSDPSFSFMKYIGFFSVLSVCSPLITNINALKTRNFLWANLMFFFSFIGIASAILTPFGIEEHNSYFGLGNAGLTNHAMLLSPFSGLATVYLFTKATGSAKKYYYLLSLLSFFSVLLSLSRIAVIATVTATSFSLLYNFKHKNIQNKITLAVLLLLGCTFIVFSFDYGQKTIQNNSDLNAFESKEVKNSRAAVWHARTMDFQERPWLGQGLGLGRITASRHFKGPTHVEPGSSYFGILAMLGLFGFVSFAIIIVSTIKKFLKTLPFLQHQHKLELMSIGIFLSIHALVEGWLIGPGAAMCVIGWLWLGRINDCTLIVKFRKKRHPSQQAIPL